MTRKLDHAIALYLEGIRDGHYREAVAKYTGPRYTQHSTGVPDGPEGFAAFFEAFVERHPRRDIRVVRAIEDGRHVFCHATQDLDGGAARWVTMDLFDTDAQDRIVEHWDVIEAWRPDAPDGRTQVGGETEVRDLDRTDSNKARVRAFVERVLIGGALEAMDELVAEDLVQHDLQLADGARAWKEHLAARRDAGEAVVYREVFRLVGQGNFVATYCKVDLAGVAHAVFDVYRLDGRRIVERWVNAEVVPADPANSGKF